MNYRLVEEVRVPLSIKSREHCAIPLTISQKFFFQSMQELKGTWNYNLSFSLIFKKGNSLKDVLSAISTVVESYASLRTVFILQGGRPIYQSASQDAEVPVGIVEIYDANIQNAVQQVTENLEKGEFEIHSKPPIRFIVFTRNGEGIGLSFACSHLLLDATSKTILKMKLSELLCNNQRWMQIGEEWNAFDQAEFETGIDAQMLVLNSSSYWRSKLPSASRHLYKITEEVIEPHMSSVFELTSTSMAIELTSIAKKTRVSASSIMVCLTYIFFSKLLEVKQLGATALFEGRIEVRSENSLACFSRPSLVILGGKADNFLKLLRTVHIQLLEGYMHSLVDSSVFPELFPSLANMETRSGSTGSVENHFHFRYPKVNYVFPKEELRTHVTKFRKAPFDGRYRLHLFASRPDQLVLIFDELYIRKSTAEEFLVWIETALSKLYLNPLLPLRDLDV